MAENQNGLGLLYHIPEGPAPENGPVPKSQTELYFQGIKNALPAAKYNDDSGKEYLETKGPDNGLQNLTKQPNKFGTKTYIETIDANGSSILNVNGDQAGNVNRATSGEEGLYNQYYLHPKP